MPDGYELDSTAIRTAHRIEQGCPPFYQSQMLYGFQVRDDSVVCVPLRFRTAPAKEF